jgi:serine/threonine-protein kinase
LNCAGRPGRTARRATAAFHLRNLRNLWLKTGSPTLSNTLGRYHIIREIARSNDIVYEAMDPSQGRKIALKELLMPPNLVGNARQERIQRFTREARAAARLRHPSIVRIHDHGQVQGRYYIAMEFLQGQSLRDLLRQRGALPVQEALRIAAAAADGLQYAHEHGVVHRDVKPDNIHLEPDGRVVITDFGIARLTFEPTLTADGQIFGTPSYMSPEQVTGKGIDKRSDIFSLGVMLYEMVAGRKPFTGDSVITITYNIMNMEAPPIPGAPPGIDLVVRKAMSKDPNRRYRTAAEMAEDLRAIAQGGMPRHAAASPAPAGRPAPAMPRSAPAPAPSRPAPAPLPGPRPMPQPVFGGQPGAYAPAPGPLPRGAAPYPAGAVPRPLPGPLPTVGGYGVPGAVPMPVNGAAAPVLQARQRQKAGGSDIGWLLGWMGVAMVIGGLVIGLVWLVLMAGDRLQKDTSARASEELRVKADRAFGSGRFQEAMAAYAEVANGSTGERRQVALKNAAVAGVELAESHLKAGKPEEAEKAAREAVRINPDSAPAYVALGRSLVRQGRVDEAVAEYDRAPEAASRTARSGASQQEIDVARSAAGAVPLWKAEALYEDGLKLMAKDPSAARKRFEETMQVAPRSGHARNAANQIGRMRISGMIAPGDAPGVPGPGAGDGPAGPPPNWDPSYRLFGGN